MSNFTFTPTEEKSNLTVPFFEDATAAFAPYYSSQKTVDDAKSEIRSEVGKLDASVNSFVDGYFGSDPKRYGYLIEFLYNGAPGVIKIAGLPIRKVTESKLKRVKVQALLNVRDWLKASVTQHVFSPGSNPLIMNLLVPNTQQTLLEYMKSGNFQNMLQSGDDKKDTSIVDGEFSEVNIDNG